MANHHGYFNVNGDRYVRALQTKVFVIPAWDSAHPTVNVLNTLFSKAIYPGNRDVFATLVQQVNRIANKKTDDLKSRGGHIVLRVEPGGEAFGVHILSNADESDAVISSLVHILPEAHQAALLPPSRPPFRVEKKLLRKIGAGFDDIGEVTRLFRQPCPR